MPNFVWKGKARTGQLQQGVLLADSRNAAVAALRRQQIQVTSIKEQSRQIPLLPRLPVRVPRKRLAVFTRQFSVMLDAGLPLVQCLEILGTQEDNRHFREIIRQTRIDVESGASLADAMRKHPVAFDDLYVSMIAAGEAGGILDIILQRLSTYIEKSVRLRAQVRTAMMYPVAVISIATLVVWVILWKVIPVFAQLFAGVGAELPFLTRTIIAASNFVGRYSIFIFAIGIAGGMMLNRWHKTYRGRRVIDGMLLRLPVLGQLLLKIAVARFCRTLATLTSSGVPILEGLEITARTSGNAIVEDAIMAVRKAVEEGKTISEPLAETKVFPPMVVQMINVGEQTGALDQMLSKIADFYEEEVDTAVQGLMKLIEPLLITFLGGIIGTIVTAMYMPMYTIIKYF
ncbi:MAG TPA: type II secretion system F family protein [Thermoanaerobaculia bacterium]|nr:type II secretion system F family protein [Thermoanaerobaculia bacterium]